MGFGLSRHMSRRPRRCWEPSKQARCHGGESAARKRAGAKGPQIRCGNGRRDEPALCTRMSGCRHETDGRHDSITRSAQGACRALAGRRRVGAGAAEHRPEARGDPVRRAGVRRAHAVTESLTACLNAGRIIDDEAFSRAHRNMRRLRIILIAHDDKKTDLVEWTRFNAGTLCRHDLIATAATGEVIRTSPASRCGRCCTARPAATPRRAR